VARASAVAAEYLDGMMVVLQMMQQMPPDESRRSSDEDVHDRLIISCKKYLQNTQIRGFFQSCRKAMSNGCSQAENDCL